MAQTTPMVPLSKACSRVLLFGISVLPQDEMDLDLEGADEIAMASGGWTEMQCHMWIIPPMRRFRVARAIYGWGPRSKAGIVLAVAVKEKESK